MSPPRIRALARLGLAVTLGGCSASSGAGTPRVTGDAGALDVVDGGSFGGVDAGSPTPPFDDGGPGGASGPDDGSVDPRGGEFAWFCGNGLDDDLDGLVDCEEIEGCGGSSLCCVGRTTDACCAASTGTTRLDASALVACDAGPVSACPTLIADATPYGANEPELRLEPTPDGTERRVIAPVGRDAESGLVLSTPIDAARDVVRLVATIAAPTGCGADCIDGVAVSLGVAGTGRPTPIVGVLVSAARGDVSLVVAGAVVGRLALPDDAPHAYALETRPSGEISLAVDGAPASLASAFEVPAGPLHAMLHGFAENRPAGAAPPPRVSSIDVETFGCDRPQALDRGADALDAGPPAPWGPAPARAPSVATNPARVTRMVFEAGGAIWLASPGPDGFVVAPGAAPILAQGTGGYTRFESPELVALDDRWALLVTGVAPDGARALLRVDAEAGWREAFDVAALTPIFTPDPGGARPDVVEVDGASAVRLDGRLFVAARARDAEGRTSLVLLREGATPGATLEIASDVCGTGCDLRTGAPDGRIHAPSGDPFAFDHDEVAAPSITVADDGVVRVHYAGRRGTRWSIGLLVAAKPAFSGDAWVFRPAFGTDAVLRPSGTGADALGVADPELAAVDGGLRLFYSGLDGVSTRVLAARAR